MIIQGFRNHCRNRSQKPPNMNAAIEGTKDAVKHAVTIGVEANRATIFAVWKIHELQLKLKDEDEVETCEKHTTLFDANNIVPSVWASCNPGSECPRQKLIKLHLVLYLRWSSAQRFFGHPKHIWLNQPWVEKFDCSETFPPKCSRRLHKRDGGSRYHLCCFLRTLLQDGGPAKAGFWSKSREKRKKGSCFSQIILNKID